MNKELIKKRFSRKLGSYNTNARIQKQMAERIFDFLPVFEYDSVLEIGCGTGLLTKFVVNKLKYSKYTALDIVSDCYDFIKEISSDIEFVSEDVEKYIKSVDKKYDLIISNASLQWIENLPALIKNLTEKLNPNGVLLFSTFGKENFREIYYVLGKTLSYFSKKDLEEKFPHALIEEEVRVMAFKTPKDVLKHIHNTGVNAISDGIWTKQDLTNFEKEYNAFCANHPTLTYNPIYVLIKK